MYGHFEIANASLFSTLFGWFASEFKFKNEIDFFLVINIEYESFKGN